MHDASSALSNAISLAKRGGRDEVSADDILLGALQAWSRFGIATVGEWEIDVEALGAQWLEQPEKAKVAYSDDAVAVLDLAAKISRSDANFQPGAPLQVAHLLAAFSSNEVGIMGRLKRDLGITAAGWRAALARMAVPIVSSTPVEVTAPASSAAEYLSPEQAAEELSVHVQTMRAYVRSGRVPALRIAGERALRIRRADLEKLFEPVQTIPEEK